MPHGHNAVSLKSNLKVPVPLFQDHKVTVWKQDAHKTSANRAQTTTKDQPYRCQVNIGIPKNTHPGCLFSRKNGHPDAYIYVTIGIRPVSTMSIGVSHANIEILPVSTI